MKTRNVGGIGSVELNFTERVTVSRCCYCKKNPPKGKTARLPDGISLFTRRASGVHSVAIFCPSSKVPIK